MGVGLLLLAALVLFPGFSLFGLHYIKGDSVPVASYVNLAGETNNQSAEWAETETVLIRTDSWDVEVRPATVQDEHFAPNSISAIWYRQYNGFVVGDIQEPTFSGAQFEQVNGTNCLVYEVLEPGGGLLTKVNTQLIILYDASTFGNRNLIIQTNSGDVIIGNDVDSQLTQNFSANEISVTSGSGNVYLGNVSVTGELRVSKESGDFTSQVDLPVNVYIGISSGLGTINLTNVGTGAGQTGLILQTINNANISFDDIRGDLVFEGQAGLITGGRVEGALSVNGGDLDINLDEVVGNVDCDLSDGTLDITTVRGNVTSKTTGGGRVYIDSILGTANIETSGGEILLLDTRSDVTCVSGSGKITVTGSSNTAQYTINSRSGECTLNNIYGSVYFETLDEGNARINIEYQDLSGENYIKTQTGAINITVRNDDSFYFKGWNTANNVSIRLSGCETTAYDNTETTEFPNGAFIYRANSQSTDTLEIRSVSGSITATGV